MIRPVMFVLLVDVYILYSIIVKYPVSNGTALFGLSKFLCVKHMLIHYVIIIIIAA